MKRLIELLSLFYMMILYAMLIVSWQWLPWEGLCLLTKVLVMPIFVIYGYVLWHEFDRVIP